MKQEIREFRHKDGRLQRVQMVSLDDFDELKFFRPEPSSLSFERLYHLYHDYIIPKYSYVFGYLVLFHVPEDVKIPFDDYDEEHGTIFDPLSVVMLAFRKNIYVHKGEICFKDDMTREFYHLLEDRGALYLLKGRRNSVSVLPVSERLGFLSESRKGSGFRVNCNFFVMDKLDCSTVFDHVGSPIGMMVKDGKVMSPALFKREALIVYKDGSVKVRQVNLDELRVIIDGKVYENGKNCLFCSRPEYTRTPEGGTDLVVCSDRIYAYKKRGNSPVPSGGFVVHVYDDIDIDGYELSYEGMEDVKFAIQVGNSAIIDGKKTEGFISPFYNYLRPFTVAYTPTMYPLNYKKDRAPRIVIGSDNDDRPVILWFEGAGKFGYDPERDSAGASLMEVADICEELNIRNAVNLDGGGSAQIIYEGKRYLKLSDRDPDDLTENERGIATGLYV